MRNKGHCQTETQSVLARIRSWVWVLYRLHCTPCPSSNLRMHVVESRSSVPSDNTHSSRMRYVSCQTPSEFSVPVAGGRGHKYQTVTRTVLTVTVTYPSMGNALGGGAATSAAGRLVSSCDAVCLLRCISAIFHPLLSCPAQYMTTLLSLNLCSPLLVASSTRTTSVQAVGVPLRPPPETATPSSSCVTNDEMRSKDGRWASISLARQTHPPAHATLATPICS